MPRDINGNFTLAPGNPVVSGTIITSTWANDTMADIKEALSDSLSRTGKGGMLVPFVNLDGTAATPSVVSTSYPTTGLYWSSGDLRYSKVGVDKGLVMSSKMDSPSFENNLTAPNLAYKNASNTFTGAQLFNGDVRLLTKGTAFELAGDDGVDGAGAAKLTLDNSSTLLLRHHIDGSFKAQIVSYPSSGDVELRHSGVAANRGLITTATGGNLRGVWTNNGNSLLGPVTRFFSSSASTFNLPSNTLGDFITISLDSFIPNGESRYVEYECTFDLSASTATNQQVNIATLIRGSASNSSLKLSFSEIEVTKVSGSSPEARVVVAGDVANLRATINSPTSASTTALINNSGDFTVRVKGSALITSDGDPIDIEVNIGDYTAGNTVQASNAVGKFTVYTADSNTVLTG